MAFKIVCIVELSGELGKLLLPGSLSPRRFGFDWSWMGRLGLGGGNLDIRFLTLLQGFPGSASGKEPSCQCRRHETRIQSLGKSPEEGMATHSSILAWRIPWIEEPGRLQSMGSQELDMT